MDQADEELLAQLGPPPYHITTRLLTRLFKQYKPRDITVWQMINAPAWIEQAGRHTGLYRLFWQNVPLLIPAEAHISVINQDTNEDLAELSFDNVDRFIERYFLGSYYSWMADVQKIVFEIPLIWYFEESLREEATYPEVDVDNLCRLFEVYDKLQCWDYPDRLTSTIIWKDARGDKQTSKQPNTKRNVNFELGIGAEVHGIVNEAFQIWREYLVSGANTNPTKEELKLHLAQISQTQIHSLWSETAVKRGYVKLWMINAFDAVGIPGMRMDEDMQACLAWYQKPLDEIWPEEEMLDTSGDPPIDWQIDELRLEAEPYGESEAEEGGEEGGD